MELEDFCLLVSLLGPASPLLWVLAYQSQYGYTISVVVRLYAERSLFCLVSVQTGSGSSPPH